MSDRDKTPIDRLEDRVRKSIVDAVELSGLLDSTSALPRPFDPVIEVEGFVIAFTIKSGTSERSIRLASGTERDR